MSARMRAFSIGTDVTQRICFFEPANGSASRKASPHVRLRGHHPPGSHAVYWKYATHTIFAARSGAERADTPRNTALASGRDVLLVYPSFPIARPARRSVSGRGLLSRGAPIAAPDDDPSAPGDRTNRALYALARPRSFYASFACKSPSAAHSSFPGFPGGHPRSGTTILMSAGSPISARAPHCVRLRKSCKSAAATTRSIWMAAVRPRSPWKGRTESRAC
jgi:hypothetical protein